MLLLNIALLFGYLVFWRVVTLIVACGLVNLLCVMSGEYFVWF